jgi:hypothetical protein
MLVKKKISKFSIKKNKLYMFMGKKVFVISFNPRFNRLVYFLSFVNLKNKNNYIIKYFLKNKAVLFKKRYKPLMPGVNVSLNLGAEEELNVSFKAFYKFYFAYFLNYKQKFVFN